MVAARKRENQNRINYKTYLFFYGKKILQYNSDTDHWGFKVDVADGPWKLVSTDNKVKKCVASDPVYWVQGVVDQFIFQNKPIQDHWGPVKVLRRLCKLFIYQ